MKKKIAIILALFIMLISQTACSFTVDYAKIINYITLNSMRANFVVQCEIREFGIVKMTSQGSGTIIKREKKSDLLGDYYYKYYLITNNHVVLPNYKKSATYTVSDYKGNSISNCTLEFYSSEYDLAVVSFTTENEYNIISISQIDVAKREPIFSLGTPKGQINAITVGKVNSISTAPEVKDSEYSKVTFDVIYHSAYLDNGSSGGALLNSKGVMVGVNYAGSTSEETGEFIMAYSVPATKILEFLKKNSFSI